MEKEVYSKGKMELIHKKIQTMIKTVVELEEAFPGRHFTLDGHLVGSIGEVLAAYYYGIDLYEASEPVHDGEDKTGRKVQIKITQQDNIVISSEPEYLLVLYLRKTGNVYEVYNGPGKEPWDMYPQKDSHNNRHMLVNKLMELDAKVAPEKRIEVVKGRSIEKMKKEYKNKKTTKKKV